MAIDPALERFMKTQRERLRRQSVAWEKRYQTGLKLKTGAILYEVEEREVRGVGASGRRSARARAIHGSGDYYTRGGSHPTIA